MKVNFMKKSGFVEAVKKAINSNTDNWEAYYYMGNLITKDEHEWDPKKTAVYMHARQSALGPEWGELRRCIMQMDGVIPRVKQVCLECT